MLFVLLAVEYRAIDKEHLESVEAQKRTLQQIGSGFETVLTNQQTNFSSLIQSSQDNFSNLIDDEKKHFERMMDNSLSAQRQERREFDALLGKRQDLLAHQEELYEFARGGLLPANDP